MTNRKQASWKIGDNSGHRRLEAEPCYDTPRVSNFANEVKTSVDDIIAECERTGIITATQNLKMAKGAKA